MTELPSAAELAKLAPMPLTDDELELLEDVGNIVLNDFFHDRACACSKWRTEEGCVSGVNTFDSDTSYFGIALRVIFAAWAQINIRHLSGLAMANPGVKLVNENGLALGEVATVNSNLRNSINEAVEGLVKVLADLRNT